jgi:rubrerythrin
MGLCVKCGYDLRGNPAGKTCPECGAPIPSPLPPSVA